MHFSSRQILIGIVLISIFLPIQLLAADEVPDPSVLFDAIRGKKETEVLTLIDQGVDVNARNRFGFSTLNWAIQFKASDMVFAFLIDAGATFSEEDDIDTLFKSALDNNAPLIIVKQLISNGADPALKQYDGTSFLHDYVMKKNADPEIVVELIKGGADVNAAKGFKKERPLLLAVRYSNPDVVKALIENGADIAKTAHQNESLIKHALGNANREEMIYALISSGVPFDEEAREATEGVGLSITDKTIPAEINEFLKANDNNANLTDQNGETPLIIALRNDRSIEIIKGWIDVGADVNYGTTTPLMIAAQNVSDPKIIELLIASGSDISDVDYYGKNALIYSLDNKNPEILKYFLEIGQDPNFISGERNESLLMLAISSKNESKLNLIRVLVEYGANVNAIDAYGVTPIMYAGAFRAQEGIIQFLLDKGATVHNRDQNGYNALMYALSGKCSSNDIMRLIDNGASVKAQSKVGETPLMLAAFNNYDIKVFQALITGGANVNVTITGRPILIGAYKQEYNNTIFRIPYTNFAGFNALAFAAGHCSDPNVISYLIEKGSDTKISIDSKIEVFGKDHTGYDDKAFINYYGVSILHYAAALNQNPKILETLIENGFDVNIVSSSQNRPSLLTTPLHFAAYVNTNPEVIEYLLNAGSKYKYEDLKKMKVDSTPLMNAAAANPNPDIILKFIEVGNGVNEVSTGSTIYKESYFFGEKNTPLLFAAMYNTNPEIISILLNHESDVSYKNEKNDTAKEMANTNPNLQDTSQFWELIDAD